MKVAKIGEASRKKDELNSSYINSTKEALETKMETVVEKREALISDKKEKLKVSAYRDEGCKHLMEINLLPRALPRTNCRRLRRRGRRWRSSGTRSARRLRRSCGWPRRTATRISRRSWTG